MEKIVEVNANEQYQKALKNAEKFIEEIPAEKVVQNVGFWLHVLITKSSYLDSVEAKQRKKDGVPSSSKNIE